MSYRGERNFHKEETRRDAFFFYREATLFLPVGISDLTLLSDRFSSQSLKDLVYNERTASIRVSNKRSRLIDRRKPFSI